MTPLPTPYHYLYNLIVMTSSEKAPVGRSIREYFDNTCVYCGKTYDLSQLSIDHVHPRSLGGADGQTMSYVPALVVIGKGSEHWLKFIRAAHGINPLREYLIEQHIH